ncbi:MAG: sulfoxide reductase heme-binding subunit YedZ [Nitrospirae bacterium]|nr:sulfoxide reductase heme-binding subunit YedZ [Nitrospirota bacterium]MBF0590896.1 sulfoxide reductase heme-binding subunit YedZ [Nitrospirota bacterium]
MTVSSEVSTGVRKKVKIFKAIVVCAGFLPTVWLLWRATIAGLGADPVTKVIHTTGDWTLRLVVLALALRAFKRVSNSMWANILHSAAGFFAFYHVSLHILSYVALDQFFDFNAILEDISQHRRIIVGLIGYVLLGAVAITSLKVVMKKIGYQRWKKVHRLTYVVPICGIIHYMWLVKKDIRIPLVYTVIVAFLIAFNRIQRSKGTYNHPTVNKI